MDRALRGWIGIALAAVLAGAAHAQWPFGAAEPEEQMETPPHMDAAECAKLAALPDAPISLETCRAMLQMGGDLERGAADPGGRRPGDEQMTCEQIFDELATIDGAGLSEEAAERTGTALDEYLALRKRQEAEKAALGAAAAAAGGAAAMADAAAVVASGGLAPPVAGAAVNAAASAAGQSLAKRQQIEEKPVKGRLESATSAAARELGGSARANPRFARLLDLGMKKSCDPSKGERGAR